jgi:signal transduction histidine kinase
MGRACAQVAFVALILEAPVLVKFASELARVRIPGLFAFALVSTALATVIVCVPSLTWVAARPHGGIWPIACPAFVLMVACTVPGVFYAVFVVARAWSGLPPSRRRRQLGWALAALSIGATSAVDVITVAWPWLWPLGPIGWASGALSCVVLFYAIAQHRLMAIRTFTQQVALGVAGALLAALVIWGVTASGHASALSTRLLAVTAFVLFVGVRGWASVVEPALAKVLGRRRRLIERAINEFERRSLDPRDRSVVRRNLSQAVKEGFGAQLVTLLEADRSRDDEPILLDSAEAALAELGAPVLRDLMEPTDAHASELIMALEHLQADSLVPLFSEGVLIAFAVLAGRTLRTADDAMAEDLARLGERTARALVNARLYEEVDRRGRGLEAQIRLRTAELENALVELKTAQARLVEAERSSSLGLLVAGISHEINNALNFISANLPTLQRYTLACEGLLDRAGVALAAAPPLTSVRAELPGRIITLGETTRRTSAIVGDLRKFARPDTERRLFRIDEGIDAALNLLRRRTDGRLDIARVYVGAPVVDCYPGPLNQCFFNVLLNAVEAARSEVWVVVQEPQGGGVEVLISDDGEGISREHFDQIFQPFFTTKPTAAGLGLTVAKGVVERHGGSIRVTSEPGQGVTVRVRLPASAPLPRNPSTEAGA